MYPENLEETQTIICSMNMGYDKYLTLPGLKLATCYDSSVRPCANTSWPEFLMRWSDGL